MLARTPEECLLPSLDTPSLEGLSWMLRHPEKWPKTFEWYYGNCRTCAMGLANKLWGLTESESLVEYMRVMPKALGIHGRSAERIFLGRYGKHIASWVPIGVDPRTGEEYGDSRFITPEMVADEIDAYLARRS